MQASNNELDFFSPAIIEKIGEKELARLNGMEVGELEEDIGGDMADISNRFLLLAVKVAIYERKGGDLQKLRLHYLSLYRKVGSGQVHPDVVTKFIGNPTLIKKVVSLPMPDQERLVSGKVELVELVDGRYDTRRIPNPLMLSAEQIQQVIASDHIRENNEQIIYLQREKSKQVEPDEFDQATVNYRIGKHSAPLTRAQRRKLEAAIAKNGIEVVIKALKAAGLL